MVAGSFLMDVSPINWTCSSLWLTFVLVYPARPKNPKHGVGSDLGVLCKCLPFWGILKSSEKRASSPSKQVFTLDLSIDSLTADSKIS